MADQPHPDDVSGDDDPDVLSTKLHVPGPPRSFVARPRLVERLDATLPGTVALVCAPAGSGKSALVADWCRRVGSSVAWLSLDADDDDPVRFWRHVAAALDHSLGSTPSLQIEVGRLVRSSTDPQLDAVVAAVVNAIGGRSDDVLLVLDDYHLIADDDVHAAVRLLLERAPRQLRVVVISRVDPPLLLARRRARGELTELRATELRFTSHEAADLVAGSTGTRLADDAIATLTDRTEGWAAGLQLAALSIEGRDDVASFLSGFSGTHRFVLDYLTEEVLDRQPAPLREFMLSTCVLRRLSGPLCDAVTGGSDGQEMLEAGERANLFLVALDDDRTWWRYHHLFADLLRVRLDQRGAGAADELHRRAAAWYEEHGLVDEAIDHALEAGDAASAARLIERHADELLLRREGATLRHQLARLPSELGSSRRLLLAHARTAVYAGRPTEAEAMLAASASAADRSAPFEPSLAPSASPLLDPEPTRALLEAFVAHLRGRADEAMSIARRTLDGFDVAGSAVELIARWHLATGPWLHGEIGVAEPALVANIDALRSTGDHDRAAWGSQLLARVQRARGDLDAAAATYERVLTIDLDRSGADAPIAGVAHVGLAEVAYERDELDAARHHLASGIPSCRQLVTTQSLASGLAVLAWVRRAEGDVDGARAAIDEAIEVGPSPEVVDLLNPVPTRRAQLLLAEGDERAAQQWTRFRGVGPDDEPHHPDEPAHLLLARLLIARGRGSDAVPLLDRLVASADADGRTATVMEAEMLRALALAGDDPSAAVASLGRAVELAAPQGHVRLFVDAGAAIAPLLGRLISGTSASVGADGVLDHAARLVRSLDRGDGRTNGGTASSALVVPLTDRELDVLRQLATGKQNREIAADLYVSLNTVKKHVTHIFDKLGVSNRTAAVDRARTLGLVG